MSRVLGSTTATVITFALAVASLVVGLLAWDGLTTWFSDNASWFTPLLLTVLLAVVLVAGHLYERLSALEDERRLVLPSDARLFRRIASLLPPQGGAMATLQSDSFQVKRFKWGNLSQLQDFVNMWREDASAEFVDAELQEAATRLDSHTTRFLSELYANVYADDEDDVYSMSVDSFGGDQGAMREREREIMQLGDGVVQAHAYLLRRAHERGLTIDREDGPS